MLLNRSSAVNHSAADASPGNPDVKYRQMANEDYLQWIRDFVDPQFAGLNYNNRPTDMSALLPSYYNESLFETIVVWHKHFSRPYQAAFHSQSDCRYSCPAHRGAALIAGMGHPVYLHLFNSPSMRTIPFATHGSDIKLMFLKVAGDVTDAELQLSAAMGILWTNFARDSDPNLDTGEPNRFTHQVIPSAFACFACFACCTICVGGSMLQWPAAAIHVRKIRAAAVR